MIDQLAASKSAAIVANIPESVYLSAPTDSYLHKLADLFDPVGGEFDPTGNLLSEVSGVTPEGIHIHHVKVQEYAQEVANAVMPLIHMARNMVVPDYRTVVEEVETYMASKSEDVSGTLGYTIEYVERCTFSKLPNIINEAKLHANIVATVPQVPNLVPEDLAPDTIIKALETTDEYINEQIGCVVRNNLGRIISVMRGRKGITEISTSEQAVIMLYSQYIYDAPVEGLGCTLHDYNAGIRELTEQLGRRLHYYIETWEDAVARGMMFVSPRVGNVIRVNGDVYRQGTTNGITPEVIFANEQRGRKYLRLEDLQASVVELTQDFLRESNMLRVAFDNDANEMMRVALQAAMIRLIQSKAEDAIPAPADTLVDMVKDRIRQLTHNQVADMGCTARDLVCDILYPHSGAKVLLTTADHIGEEQPDIEPREAFTYAVVDYVASWFASQLIQG